METLELEQHCRIEAAHSLPWHKGKCKRPHGHSYAIEIKLEYSGVRIPLHDFLVDFGDIKNVCEKFDHKNLNEHPSFGEMSTTVENFTEVLTNELHEFLLTHTKFIPRKIVVRIQEGLGSHWATRTTHYT